MYQAEVTLDVAGRTVRIPAVSTLRVNAGRVVCVEGEANCLREHEIS